jgi:hypothetical protein
VGVECFFLVVGRFTTDANLLLYDRSFSRLFARAILINSRLIKTVVSSKESPIVSGKYFCRANIPIQGIIIKTG